LKKGWTLVELVVVVIFIAVLAMLGMIQYNRMIEKGRTAEARAVLSLIRSAEHAYKQQYGNFTSVLELLGVENLVTSCASTHFYYYRVAIDKGVATRCTVSGKYPNAAGAYSITITHDLGDIGGDAPYY
jgi:Tfp pilus assembly protein PilE